MDLNNLTMQSIGPAVILLLVIGLIVAGVVEGIEEVNKGRKQRQREREWDVLSKP